MLTEEAKNLEEDVVFIHTKVIIKTSWGIIICCLCWMGLAFYLDEPVIALLTGPALFGTILAVVLALLEMPLLARSVWSAFGILSVTLANFTLPSAANPEIMYLVLLGGPFLTFAIGRENFHLMLTFRATVISLSAVLILGNDFFGTPWVNEDIARTYLAPGTLIMVFILIGIEMGTFGILAHTEQVRLEASRRQARRASRAKSDFLAAMSHEIRTPMNGVVGMVEILETSKLTTEQSRIVETIKDSSTALLSIIEDILDMSRIEAGKLALTLQQTEILKVFEKSADTLRHFADAHNVTLSMCYDPQLPKFISCDPGRLRQITLNLLSNAIKFSKSHPEGPRGQVLLTIGFSKKGDLEFTVSDNGIGIAQEFIESLFDPFEQSAAVRRHDFGGSGLGLAIVSQLVEKLGGSVKVESQIGCGSSFTVQFPIVDAKGQTDLPDLTGKTIAGVKNPVDGLPCFKKIIEGCNAEFKTFETREALVEAAQTQNDNVVYIIPCGTDEGVDENASIGHEAWEIPEESKTIFLSNSQDQFANQELAGEIILSSSPILISALIDTLVGIFELEFPKQDIRHSSILPLPAKVEEGGGPRILAAEDNQINRVVLTSQLEKLGHSAVVVEDGAKAFEAWQRGGCDLILTDCQMPTVDGFELTRMIREKEAVEGLARTPIIAITANALRGEGDRCLAVGMDGYLTKPTSLEDLRAALELHFVQVGSVSAG
jgi:signal transduction histidine kinase/CheY-like chemotaxis protein